MYLDLVNKPVVNQLLSVSVCVHVCACLCVCVGVWHIRQKLPPAAMRFQLRIIHTCSAQVLSGEFQIICQKLSLENLIKAYFK